MLSKMRIDAYEASSCTGAAVQSYEMMFNPSGFDEDWTIRWTEQQPQGTSGTLPQFNAIAPQSYAFDFLVDGTGAAGGPPVNVYANLTSFLKLMAS